MSRNFALAIMLMVSVILSGCEGNTKESLNSEGMSLSRKGNYNGAIIHYKNALEKDQNYLEARFNLGLAYVETGKLEQAEREFQKILLQNPYDTRIGLQFGRIENLKGKPEAAVPWLKKYLAGHPDSAEAFEQLAMAATLADDLSAARSYLEKALASDPGRDSARLALAYNLMAQGDRGGARQLIEKLLADQPSNNAGLHALARLETQDRDTEGMLGTYSRIASIYPGDMFARYKEGSLLLDKGDMDKVKMSAASMIKEYPGKADGYRLLGLIHCREGKYEEAAASLQKSIRIQPDLEAYYLLGIAHYYLGNLELAITQFQTVLDYSPQFLQARVMLCDIFLRQGRGAEARLVAEKMMETHPNDSRGHALRGDALLVEGKSNAALKEYDHALTLAPGHYGLLLKRGQLKLSLDDVSGEEDLLAAVKASPQGSDARLALHSYYLRMKRPQEAMSIVEGGLRGGKGDAVLYNAMAKASLGQRDGEACERYLAKAREADPSFPQTYYNAAIYLLSLGKNDEAIAQYDLVLAMKPDDVRALIGEATILDMQDKTEAARERLERARATGDSASALMLARFLVKHQRSDEAIQVLEEELRRHPSDLAIVEAKARLHMARKETDKAMAMYGKLEAADPWGGAMERTKAWMAARELGKAEESAQRLIQLNPDRAASYVPMASIREARGDIPGAEALLRKAVSMESENAQAGVALGEFQLRHNELSKAAATFREVLRRSPTDPSALTGQGIVLQVQGRNAEATESYLRAVQAQHDFAPALNNLAMLYSENEETRLQALNLAMAAFTRSGNDPAVIDTLGYVLIKNKRADEALRVLDRAKSMAPSNAAIKYHLALAYAELDRREEAIAMLESALVEHDFEERQGAEQLLGILRNEKEGQ